MRKNVLKVVLVFLFLFLTVGLTDVSAKKSLLRRGKSGGSTSGVIISSRLRSDRLALIVNFTNLNLVRSLSYSLTYNTNGRPEAVQGTITPKVNSEERTLVFGTYSSGAWRFHANITNMKFAVTSNLKSGKKIVKTFRIKP